MEENIVYDASKDAQMEQRSTIDTLREDGKITGYKFKILIRDKAALEGTLTRHEVDDMYRLYAAEGANLTQKAVSRYFPLYTFQEFKKILRAFNITKASAPFAPHILEEKTTEELIALNMQRKESDYLKKYEHNKESLHEAKYKELLRTHHDLKESLGDFKEFLGDIKLDIDFKITKPDYSSNSTLIVYLSDMHIGAEVSDYSIYRNPYNKEEVQSRMTKVINKIIELASFAKITNLIICNIGDSLDGYNGQTTRGGHGLPQNMNNKDQYKTYITTMVGLFKTLSTSGYFETIKYVCVEGGNHDGDFGYVANKALEASLYTTNPEIEVIIFDRFIDHITVGNHTFIMCHGKDAKDMFKNMPLVLNDKIENQINEYIDYHNIQGNIHFIKGDLHQTATTFGKKFRYKSVASFFGSSEWIHKNFGNTKAAIDFDIVSDTSILETRLVLN